jgi:hypothetical protein
MAIKELHRAENGLAAELLRASDRHRADHEVHHVARDLAGWSREHVRRLADAGEKHGLSLDPEARGENDLLAALFRMGGDLLGRDHEAALLLIRDLRGIHRRAAGISLDWDVFGNAAQSLRDHELLELAERCHPQTLRQMRWADAMVKEVAAQSMVVS